MCDCTEEPEFFVARDVRARREHRCHECRGAIRPGEHYHRVSGKWDGEVATLHVCLPCEVLAEWVRREGGCAAYGDVREEARDLVRILEDYAAWKAANPRLTTPVGPWGSKDDT